MRRQANATRVWTIQGEEVLAALGAGRVWRAREARVDAGWRPAYRWMARTMTDVLGPPALREQMPIWCWCQWRGERRIEPSWDRIFDLKWHSRRYTAAPAERSIQGVIWELRPADVVQSTPFVAR